MSYPARAEGLVNSITVIFMFCLFFLSGKVLVFIQIFSFSFIIPLWSTMFGAKSKGDSRYFWWRELLHNDYVPIGQSISEKYCLEVPIILSIENGQFWWNTGFCKINTVYIHQTLNSLQLLFSSSKNSSQINTSAQLHTKSKRRVSVIIRSIKIMQE